MKGNGELEIAPSDRRKKTRIAIISHTLCQEIPRKRWRLLAEKFDVEVRLIVPKIWHSFWLKKEMVFRSKPFTEGRFSITPFATTSTRNWSKYFFVSPDLGLKEYRPHLLYTVHEESIWVHQQIITYRNLWSPSSKMIFFSMNALGMKQESWHQRLRWKRVKDHYDAAVVHYPGCLSSLRGLGYNKPVYMQTQVGVDPDLYRPDGKDREVVRAQLGLTDRFVIGFAGRVAPEKGILDLLEALPLEGVDWSLLVIGDGPASGIIKETFSRKGWEGRIQLMGTLNHDKVPRYMRAMDCLVLGSRTLSHWVDTFPNVIVQAMACGVPVVGSNSGAIPFQLGDTGLVFPEGDVAKLKEHLITLGRDRDLGYHLADLGREQCLKRFGIDSLNESFYDIMQQVLTGNFREGLEHNDMRRPW